MAIISVRKYPWPNTQGITITTVHAVCVYAKLVRAFGSCYEALLIIITCRETLRLDDYMYMYITYSVASLSYPTMYMYIIHVHLHENMYMYL